MKQRERNIISNMTDAEIDQIWDLTNQLFCEARFVEVDNMLSGFDLVSICDDKIITWLTATLPAKTKLPSRAILLDQVKDRMDPELLSGLE